MIRRSITQKAKIEAMEQNALCPKCFKPFNGDVEYDHDPPLAAGGADHDEKPMTPLHASCHAIKTKADRKVIAKTKRMAGETGQYARRKKNGSQIQSRNTLGGEEGKKRREWAKQMKKGI